MSEEAAFLGAIATNPEDDFARLVYADWLDDRDEGARAECIRRGVKKPKRFTFAPGADARVSFATKRQDLGGLVDVRLAPGYAGIQWTTYKGLIESTTCDWGTWLAISETLLGSEWVPAVVLITSPELTLVRTDDSTHERREWFAIPGRPTAYEVPKGESMPRIVLNGEWPQVKRWTLPAENTRVVNAPEGSEEDDPEGANWGRSDTTFLAEIATMRELLLRGIISRFTIPARLIGSA